MSDTNTENKKGLAVAGLIAAAAAGAIYLYGKEGEKKRHDLRGWMLKVKGEVMDKMAETKNITKEKYHKIVDESVAKYKDTKHAKEPEIEDLQTTLKGHWSDIKTQVSEHADSAKAKAIETKEQAEKTVEDTSDTVKSVIAGAIIGAAREIAAEKISSKDHDTKETIKEVAKSAGKGALAGAAKEAAEGGGGDDTDDQNDE